MGKGSHLRGQGVRQTPSHGCVIRCDSAQEIDAAAPLPYPERVPTAAKEVVFQMTESCVTATAATRLPG